MRVSSIKETRVEISFLFFYLLSVFFLWIKTYLVQFTQFDLGISNLMQQFLLLLNPLGSALFFLGISMLFKAKKKYLILISMYLFLSLLLFVNVLYYRFFNDFITLPTLTQTQNFGDVSGSILSLLKPYDVLFFLDLLILILFLVFRLVKIDMKEPRRRTKLGIFTVTMIFLF